MKIFINERLGAHLTGLAFGLVLAISSASADDTEVFFGSADSDLDVLPNVLLVLDTAGSMNQGDPGEAEKRITRMKSALLEVLDTLTNINIGFAEYTGGSDGDPILYPITYIDKEVCSGTGCGEIELAYPVTGSTDDAQEHTYSALGTSVHEDAVNFGFEGRDSISTGIRFDNIMIPSGATVTNARIEFTAYAAASGSGYMELRGHDTDDSEPFNASAGSITARPTTTETSLWYPDSWIMNETNTTPNFSNVVQEIVDRSGWCGGNAMSFSFSATENYQAIAFDLDPERAPILKVSYDPGSIAPGMGCIAGSVVAQISNSADDAEENLSNNSVNTASTDLQLAKDRKEQLIGLRFNDIAVPQGATIREASLEFEIDEYQTGAITLDVWGEDTDDAAQFTSGKNNISLRTKTSASVGWVDPEEASINTRINTPNLKTITQEIVDRGGWDSGNSMAFILGLQSGAGKRTVEAYDGESFAAPVLKIVFENASSSSSSSTTLTARDEMKQLVSNLKIGGGTEIVNTLYEASHYYAGKPVNDSGRGGVSYPDPVLSSCQSNHIVLLTDGGPTNNSTANAVNTYIDKEECLSSGAGECGPDLAEWMNETDHSMSQGGPQTISTHTIGLALAKASDIEYLDMLADYGGGAFYPATSAADLVAAYNEIFSNVAKVNTSFVAPGATVNQFNRLTHREDIYFSLFKPLTTPTWDGNLKKYKLKLDPDSGIVRIYDNSGSTADDNKLAVNPDTGFFAADTQSYWSLAPDGNVVAEGGAASQLSLTDSFGTARRVYTYTSSSMPSNTSLNHYQHALHEDNNLAISKADLGISSESDEYHTQLLQWARGVDVKDDDGDGNYADVRTHMGDPMHSRPLIVNYETSTTQPDSTVFVGTNEGFLHAIDHETAEEEFAFIPQELWSNLNLFFENTSSVKHPYGLDGSLSMWIDEDNGNGVVENGEEVYIYTGMRRGGNNYYALNVTDRTDPKLAWMIKGGTTGFEELGQSWSTMVPTSVRYGNAIRNVLIFAGGYDTNQDENPDGSAKLRSLDSVGRAIYVVDAETGEKLWTGSGTAVDYGSGVHQYFPDMKYSIPSDIRVIDIDFDGLADQMYVGDMGGQLWRFDFNYADTYSNLVIDGGVIAEFAQDGDATKARRFFYEPDVALMTSLGKKFLSIGVGSGWRAHPLDTDNDDSFYLIRSDSVYSAPEGYGKLIDANSSPPTYRRLTEADLVNITADVDTTIDWKTQAGWMLDMVESGEKVLSKAITVNNQILFTSYAPERTSDSCDAAIGGGNIYVLDVLTGRPTLDLDNDGESELDEKDRHRELAHAGIAPEVSVLMTEEAPIMLVGTEQPLDEFDFGELTVRTYWREGDDKDMPYTVSTNEEGG